MGKLGDPPGATAVRDRLLAEANKKSNDFALRYSSALGLQAMGLSDLVKPIIDFEKAQDTNSTLIVVKGAMEALAAKRGVTVKEQTEVEALLGDVDIPARRKRGEWGE